MNTFNVQIITPNRIFYEGKATMLEYNTVEGQVGIFPMHIPMTQIISPGKLSIYEDGVEEVKIAALHSGFVRIMPDSVTILAEIVEWKNEIDKNRAEAAKERAEKRLSEHTENIDVKRAEFALKKALVRLSI